MKFLKDWVSERKATQVADELTPGEWFRGEWSNWQKTLQEWKKVQTDTKTKIVAKSRASKKALQHRRRPGRRRRGDGGGSRRDQSGYRGPRNGHRRPGRRRRGDGGGSRRDQS